MASDKPAPAPAAPAEEKGDAPKKSGNLKVMIAAIAVVLLEVGTVAATIRLSSGPKQALGEQPQSQPATQKDRYAEVKLIVDARLPNSKSGKVILYYLSVVVKVAEKDKEHVTSLYSEREAEVNDRIRAIIASAEHKVLNEEPGLETIRRQIAYELDQDLGKDLIKEVFIPKCIPQRTE
jgi:flagellar basal body-associated protein FliL